jgi:hypothetical protein
MIAVRGEYCGFSTEIYRRESGFFTRGLATREKEPRQIAFDIRNGGRWGSSSAVCACATEI